MTDPEIREVHHTVVSYIKSLDKPKNPDEPESLGKPGFDAVNADALMDLVDHVKRQLGFSSPTELTIERRALIAMCAIGPRSAGIPPQTMLNELMDAVKKLPPKTPDLGVRIMEIVIAYGCGKWRTIQQSGTGWDGYWQPALDQLTWIVFGWMKATAAWLHFGIPLKGYAYLTPFPSWQDASVLALVLRTGKCDCYRLRALDGPLDHQARMRQKRCLREHDLLVWNPTTVSLASFIAQAVKGSKGRGGSSQRGFLPGAVAQGIFFCELYRYSDVRFGRIIGWHCSLHPKSTFEGPRCLECEKIGIVTVFKEHFQRRKVTKCLLVRVPAGRYELEEYWHCSNKKCDTYYATHYKICPRCTQARPPGAVVSKVWELGPLPVRSGEDPVHSREGGATDTGEDPFRKLLSKEVLKLLDDVDPDGIVRQIFVEGRSEEEVANTLGLSPAALQARKDEILSQVRERYEQ